MIGTVPIMNAKITVSIPILNVCPMTLTAANDAEAEEVSSFGTELMIAFVFGDETFPVRSTLLH